MQGNRIWRVMAGEGLPPKVFGLANLPHTTRRSGCPLMTGSALSCCWRRVADACAPHGKMNAAADGRRSESQVFGPTAPVSPAQDGTIDLQAWLPLGDRENGADRPFKHGVKRSLTRDHPPQNSPCDLRANGLPEWWPWHHGTMRINARDKS